MKKRQIEKCEYCGEEYLEDDSLEEGKCPECDKHACLPPYLLPFERCDECQKEHRNLNK